MPSRQGEPLYRLKHLAEHDGQQILLHGDQQSADAGAELIPAVANLACSSETDLTPLKGLRLVMAPMVDRKLATDLPARLYAIGAESVKVIDTPSEGWTIASAIG